MMDASRDPHLYHKSLDRLMISALSESLHKLGQLTMKAAESGGSYLIGPIDVRRPAQSNLIRDVIVQRK